MYTKMILYTVMSQYCLWDAAQYYDVPNFIFYCGCYWNHTLIFFLLQTWRAELLPVLFLHHLTSCETLCVWGWLVHKLCSCIWLPSKPASKPVVLTGMFVLVLLLFYLIILFLRTLGSFLAFNMFATCVKYVLFFAT